jgi:DNA-binding SARP family transcriptional activator/TolB-like protein
MEKKPVEFRILGPTELSGPGEADADHPSPKRLALLAYLAIETADGFRRRDQIVGLLWPDLPQEGARAQLRKALSALRERLGPDVIISRGETEIRLDATRIWCDAVALNQHMRSGEWPEALSLYRGDLLEGFFAEGVEQEWEEWLADKRKGLRHHAARAAWECSRLEEERGDWKAAAVKARRALELTSDDEEGVRRLMSVLDRGGDRAGALRVYSELQARLHAEYGAEPAPETRKLARKVQAARKGESHDTSPIQEPAVPAPANGFVATQRLEPALSRRTGRRSWSFVAVGSFFLLVGVGAGALLPGVLGDCARPQGSLAVLPVRAIGSGLESVALATAEELTTALVFAPELAVHPSARAREAAACDGDADCIGRRLDVAYLLDGGVQRSEGRLRMTLRLVRTRDGAAVWASTFDADSAAGTIALQRVAAQSAAAVRAFVLRPDSSDGRSRCS